MLLLPAALLVMHNAFAQKSRLVLSDNYPSASEKINFTYSPAGTLLEGKKEVSAQVFFIDGKDFPAVDVDLKTKERMLEGGFTIPADAKAFFIKIFSDADIDNNNSNGFIYMVYKDRKPVAGAYESEAFVLNSEVGGRFAKIKADHDAAIALYKQENEAYPGVVKLFDYNYYYLLGRNRDTVSRAILISKLKKLERNTSETELHLAASISGWLGEKTSADSLNNLVKVKFPNGETMTNEEIYAILDEKITRKKDSLYKVFISKYPDSKNSNLENIQAQIIVGYLEAGNIEAAEKYALLIKKKSTLAGCFNDVAYEWATMGTNLGLAEKLSKRSVNIILENLKHPDSMPFYSPGAINQLYKDMYYNYSDSYAFILYLQKRYGEALKYQKGVYEYHKHNRPIIEHYVLILNKLGKYAECKRVIETFLKTNKSNDILYNELKIAYVGLNRSETGFNEYFNTASGQRIN